MLAQENLLNHSFIPKIENLISQLKQIENVDSVRAIAPSSEDTHTIEFEIKLVPQTDLPHDSWKRIQDLVTNCEWALDDEIGGFWSLDALFVDDFYQLPKSSEILLDAS